MRSKFEQQVASALEEAGIAYEYEAKSYELYLPVIRGHRCIDCASKRIEKLSWYTPDFFITGGPVLETKGKFTALDRKKQLAMREHHPDVPVTMVFMRNNTLSKHSKTRYSDWCVANGISYLIWQGRDSLAAAVWSPEGFFTLTDRGEK